jgi:glycosyltransferase involved in cell wall biosynthesis
MARLVARSTADAPVGPSRVVIDLRPLQEPERTPITAEYLAGLLEAFTADPLAGESFVVIGRALRPDPSVELEARGLPVAGRRVLPPTSRVFRSAGLTLDSFLLRGAEAGTADDGPVGSVYHTAGGAVPLASQLPVVATLLDLAPWELPHTYAASPAARFGHRLRARVLHDAARVIVCSRATAESARRRLQLPSERLAVVRLAVSAAFRAAGADAALRAEIIGRLGLPERYLVFAGRYDARKDMASLFAALRDGGDERAGAGVAAGQPPVPVVLAGLFDADSDEAALQRAAVRSGAADRLIVAPPLSDAERAALVGGALGFVYPALSEATGSRVLEALALGVPVICSRAGALPEIVGGGGIIVEPRDPRRMASAIAALTAGGSLAQQLQRAARRHAETDRRTWQDVARETRQVYAAAGSRPAG